MRSRVLAHNQEREVLLHGPLVGLLQDPKPRVAWHTRVRRRIHQSHDGTFWVSFQAAKIEVEVAPNGTVRTCGFHDLSRVDPLVLARIKTYRGGIKPAVRRRL